MCIKYISKKANEELIKYVESEGFKVSLVFSENLVGENISCHPDIFMCKLGSQDNSFLFKGDCKKLRTDYPGDIRYNAACTGKYFIHNLKYTDPLLLKKAKEMGMELIDVKQGYTKCSVVVVNENSIITYDQGIARACKKHPELEVLLISPGFVRLDGFDTGFIGGASGRLGDHIVFNGNLYEHPDFLRILSFIMKKNLKVKWFPSYPLTDIGSII